MPAPTAIHYFGDPSLELGEDPRIVRRSDGFDEGQFTFHGGTEDSLEPGSKVPGYPNMFVAENTTTNRSGDYEHSIRAVGLRGSALIRRISNVATDTEDGFDTGSETWIVRKGQTLQLGRAHGDHPQLYAVSRVNRNSAVEQFEIIELGFLGIKSGTKPERFRTTTSSREITLTDTTLNIPGGSDNTRTWNILRGDPVLHRSYLSLQAPDHTRVARPGTAPAQFPQVSSLSGTLSADQKALYQWPNGVVLAALDSDQVPGKNVWFITETYVQRDAVTV
jgi:hypothetical protein